jgi:uncharacterized membrane protein
MKFYKKKLIVDHKIFAGMTITALFFVLIFSSSLIGTINNFIYEFRLRSVIVLFGFIVGAGVYALMSGSLAQKNAAVKNNLQTILRILNTEERKIIEFLVANGGKALQAEITRLEGMNKLKSHRTLKRLQLRNIITLEGWGKTNKIILSGDILEGLTPSEKPKL